MEHLPGRSKQNEPPKKPEQNAFYFSWLEDKEFQSTLFTYDSPSKTFKTTENGDLNLHLRYTVQVGNDIYAFKDKEDPSEFIKYSMS